LKEIILLIGIKVQEYGNQSLKEHITPIIFGHINQYCRFANIQFPRVLNFLHALALVRKKVLFIKSYFRVGNFMIED
jgi:hypothetical protein